MKSFSRLESNSVTFLQLIKVVKTSTVVATGSIFILDEILKLGLVKILNFKFIGDADVWLCLVEIMKMKYDHDFCLNL